MENGTIQVYYGTGVGKTSAALGNAIRSAGRGEEVVLIPFMKGQLDTEYLKRLEPEIRTFRFERTSKRFEDMTDEEKQEEKANIQNGILFAKKVLSTGECDLLVLDEVLGIIQEGMVSESDVLSVLSARSPFTSVILTGNVLTPGIEAVADQVMNLVKEK